MSALERALFGPKGDLDAYLEAHGEAEVRADILALTSTDERRRFAGLAMPACIDRCASDEREPGETMPAMFARKAVECADALLAELSKEK